MRAADAARVLAHDDMGRVRRWRPATLPDVEVIEVDQTSLTCRGFEETYALWLKTEGATRVRYRRGNHDIHPGEVLLLEPGETHTVVPTRGPMSCVVLLLSPKLVSQVAFEHFGQVNEVHWGRVVAPQSSVSAEMLGLVKALPKLPSLEAKARLSRLVRTSIVQLAEPAGGTRNRDVPARGLSRARDLLHARSSEAVTLDDLVAAAECTTKQRLIRGFRAAFGFAPHQYLTELRLQRARDLLQRGHDCGKTAYLVGFYDQSQMNRHFLKYLGVTPGAYAKAVI
jgi:AraC-like DNA-binding protein